MMVSDDLYSNEKYMVLAKKYKEGTRARRMIDELNSNLGRADMCCNPECRKILGKKVICLWLLMEFSVQNDVKMRSIVRYQLIGTHYFASRYCVTLTVVPCLVSV